MVFVSIIQLKRSALLQAAAATLLGKEFARSMARRDSVLQKGAMMVFAVVVSAASIVSNQSALGNGAPRPLLQGEGVTNTAVAARKCAR